MSEEENQSKASDIAASNEANAAKAAGAKGQNQAGESSGQPYNIAAQYVKDVSFESPQVPEIFREQKQLKFSTSIDIQTRPLGPGFVEVQLVFDGHAETEDGKRVYLAQITYGGVVRVGDTPKEAVAGLLLVEVPHQLFPSVRTLFMSLVRDGGFMVPAVPIPNFLNLAKSKVEAAQARKGEVEGKKED